MLDHPYDIKTILEKDVKAEEPAENEMAVPNQIYGINYEDAHLNPKYKFDTFVVGSNNKFAHSASLAVAESPGEVYNPLYLYGGPGSATSPDGLRRTFYFRTGSEAKRFSTLPSSNRIDFVVVIV